MTETYSRWPAACTCMLAFLLWLACAAPAAAQASDAPARPTPPFEWYGWQTLAFNGGSVLLAGTAVALHTSGLSSGLALASLGAFTLGAPIVHWAHGRTGLGFASLGLHLTTLVFAGVALGEHAVSCDDVEAEGNECDAGDAMVGWAVFGAVITTIVDAAGGFEPRDEAPPRSALRPSLAFGAHAAWLGLSTDF